MTDPGQAIPRNTVRDAAEIVERDRAAQIAGVRLGRPALFTCPDCNGTLWQVDDRDVLQFRCHVGHILAGVKLFEEQTRSSENALWCAVRTLADKAVLGQQLAHEARERGDSDAAAALEEQAQRAQQKSDALRQIAEQG